MGRGEENVGEYGEVLENVGKVCWDVGEVWWCGEALGRGERCGNVLGWER